LKLDEHLKAHMETWQLKPKQRRKLAQIFGWEDFADFKSSKKLALLSDNAANNSAWFVTMVFLVQEFLRLEQQEGVQFYMLTLVDQSWNFGDKYTTINWYHIKKKASRALESIGVEGLAVLEFQAVTNSYHGDEGRLMMPNVHAIIWSKDKSFDPRKAQKRLRKTFKAKGTAKGGVIRPVTETAGGMIGAITYLTKPISSGKRLVIRPDKTEYMVLSKKYYRKNQSLRIMEILSHFKHSNLIFGRGEGTKLRQGALKAARNYQHKDWVEIDNITHLWKSARHSAGKADFMPVRILRTA
jgi:hypothetical protein